MKTWSPSLYSAVDGCSGAIIEITMSLPMASQNHLTALPWLISASSGKACTLGLIKPDAVAHGRADEIIMKVGGT